MTTPTVSLLCAGLNRTVLGGEELTAPDRNSEKDFKRERRGLHATGFAITNFSFSSISIVTKARASIPAKCNTISPAKCNKKFVFQLCRNSSINGVGEGLIFKSIEPTNVLE